ncbi:sorting assembly machinery 50 kDa subunit [Paratrimastix pyriformis]|uniref:Sorting assembly machinery 50 kDa subunit n=1 Tax=Paratrimastix pyriformis TaxID=342808 RepID=A0ABQ8UW53_9EUKA|nr:sorting assembly machinery 50 kDa subunit [Paratrimastix pyriformis]
MEVKKVVVSGATGGREELVRNSLRGVKQCTSFSELQSMLHQSADFLDGLGIFKFIDIHVEQHPPKKWAFWKKDERTPINLLVDVSEKSIPQFQLGAYADRRHGAHVRGSFMLRNLFDGAQKLRASASLGARHGLAFDFSYTDPCAWGSNVSEPSPSQPLTRISRFLFGGTGSTAVETHLAQTTFPESGYSERQLGLGTAARWTRQSETTVVTQDVNYKLMLRMVDALPSLDPAAAAEEGIPIGPPQPQPVLGLRTLWSSMTNPRKSPTGTAVGEPAAIPIMPLPRYLVTQLGDTIKSSLAHTLCVIQRTPQGISHRFTICNEMAGLGAGIQFIRHELNDQLDVPLIPRWGVHFNLTAMAGLLWPWGKNAYQNPSHISDRFFLGGGASGLLHGFRERRAGPHDNGYAVGADAQWVMSSSLSASVPWLAQRNIRALGFVSAGSAALREEDATRPLSVPMRHILAHRVRLSTGVGLALATRLGEIHVRACLPLRSEPDDTTHGFEIGLQ